MKILGLTAIVLIILFLSIPLWTPYRFYVVRSGSMTPTIRPGDVIVTGPAPRLVKPGQVVVFRMGDDLITHRVVKVVNKTQVRTKGDANPAPDPFLVPMADIEASALFPIPYLGYLVWFIRSRLGWVLIVLLPALWILAGEIKNILEELRPVKPAPYTR